MNKGLSPQTVSIGRDNRCDIVVNNPTVSRKHAIITLVGSEYQLQDCNSANGVFVNGQKVKKTSITSTDTITLGTSVSLRWDTIKSAFSAKTNHHIDDYIEFIGVPIVRVGRAKDNDIVANDPAVSRYHATIRKVDTQSGQSRYYIDDLDSCNGVFVNGKRIHSCEIGQEDAVTLGNAFLLTWDAVQYAFNNGQDRVEQYVAPEFDPNYHKHRYPDYPWKKKSGNAGSWIVATLIVIILFVGGIYLFFNNREKAPNLNIEPILSKDAVSVPVSAVIRASENEIVLSADADPSSYQTGKVIASGISDGAPYGFLRKVTGHSYQNGQIVVTTAPATLDDAFDQLGLDIHTKLNPSDLASSRPLTDGVVFTPGMAVCMSPFVSGLYAKDVKIGFEPDPLTFNYTIDKTIPLSNGISMEINGDLNLSLGYILQARLVDILEGDVYINSGTIVESSGDLNVVVNGAFSHQTKLELYEHGFSPVEFFVCGFPIVLYPKVTIVLEIDAQGSSSATTSVTAFSSFKAGAEYQKNKWKPYSEKQFSYQYSPPEVEGSIRSYISAGPRFELNFYGIKSSGPYAYARGFLELKGDINSDPLWTLDGGYRVDVGAFVNTIVAGIHEYQSPDIINQSNQLAKKNREQEKQPNPGIVYINAVNGNWNTKSELLNMFEDVNEDSSKEAMTYDLERYKYKSDILPEVYFSLLGVLVPDNQKVTIYESDLIISYINNSLVSIKFTDAACKRLIEQIKISSDITKDRSDILGTYYDFIASEDHLKANKFNQSQMECLKEPTYLVVENGSWKISVWDETLLD